MSEIDLTGRRAVAGARVLRFATERAMQTREFERRVAALPVTTPGRASMRAALGAAKAWEAAVLWLAWRLQPRTSVDR